ncbi:MAG TPA: carboxypeptidase-like regulatory domain-containing protein, partial [Planctomycetota bacterium]|nr:carboxypeptidase-like regulatory domain-containing protein [Planctomycetota bacterium]
LLAWEHLPAGAETIEFTLRAGDLDARFARLGLRVVDSGGAPIAGARVTLKADTSAHRRAEQMRVASGADGRVEFERVVPGEYELLVETDSALGQERLALAAGERREVGDVVLTDGRPIQVRVVDEDGQPALAWIEVAPLREGGRADDLYPPNLHRHTDGQGRFELQLPSTLSIVRATRMDPARGPPTGDRSYDVLVDPQRAPPGELALVVARARRVEVTTADPLAARAELIDVHGVVVAEGRVAVGRPARLDVPPGRYTARLLDGEGQDLGLRELEVRGEDVALTLP